MSQPTIDDFEELPPDAEPTVTYPDWTPSNSFVVTGPLGPDAKWKGERFETIGQARKHFVAKFGKVHECFAMEDRYFVRVPKPKPQEAE